MADDEFVIRYVPDFSAIDAGWQERERRANQGFNVGTGSQTVHPTAPGQAPAVVPQPSAQQPLQQMWPHAQVPPAMGGAAQLPSGAVGMSPQGFPINAQGFVVGNPGQNTIDRARIAAQEQLGQQRILEQQRIDAEAARIRGIEGTGDRARQIADSLAANERVRIQRIEGTGERARGFAENLAANERLRIQSIEGTGLRARQFAEDLSANQRVREQQGAELRARAEEHAQRMESERIARIQQSGERARERADNLAANERLRVERIQGIGVRAMEHAENLEANERLRVQRIEQTGLRARQYAESLGQTQALAEQRRIEAIQGTGQRARERAESLAADEQLRIQGIEAMGDRARQHADSLATAERARNDRIQNYRRLAADTIAEVGETSRRDLRRFNSRISEMGPNAQRREILARMEGLDPLDDEFQGLRQRANALRRRTGLNTEVLNMGQYMNLIFGGWEVASSFNAAMQFNNPLMNRGALQTMQTQQAAIERMSGGILGSMARGVAGFTDTLSFGDGAAANTINDLLGMGAGRMFGFGAPLQNDPTKAQRGFGLLGRYSPFAFAAAQSGAQQGIERAQAQVQVAIEARDFQTKLFENRGQVGAIEARDPFTREMRQATNQFGQTFREIQDRQFSLRQQLSLANTIGDTKSAALLVAQINQFDKESPQQFQAAGDLRDAQIRDVEFRRTQTVAAMRAKRQASAFSRSGDYLLSSLFEIESRFNTHRDQGGRVTSINGIERGNPLFDPTFEMYEEQRKQAEANDDRRILLNQAAIRASAARIARAPLRAQIEELGGQYDAALVGPISSPAELQRINDRFKGLGQEAIQARADQIIDINRNQQSRFRQISSLIQRDPYGAQVEQIVGQSRDEEMQLLRQGLKPQAEAARLLGQRQLDLTKQNYLDAFRGTQLDNSEQLYSVLFSRRDNEDPAEVLRKIRDGRDSLNDAGTTTTPKNVDDQILAELKDLNSNLAKKLQD